MFSSAFSLAGATDGVTGTGVALIGASAGAGGVGTNAAGAGALASTVAGGVTTALAGSSRANGFLYSLFEVMTSRELGL